MQDIYLIDFDRTISINDSTYELGLHHNPKLLEEYKNKFAQNEITIKEYIRDIIEDVQLTESEYIDFMMNNVKVDLGFVDFLKLEREFRIVSAGAKLNVLAALKGNGIEIEDRNVYSNLLTFDNRNIKVTFPYLDEDNYYGIDKKQIVNNYKQKEKNVIFVGDGISDYSAATASDFVFAKKDSSLDYFCKNENIKYDTFSNFKELVNKLEG